MLFSQRIGKTPAKKMLQYESIDVDLRNSLWNVLTAFVWDTYRAPGRSYVRGSNMNPLIYALWLHLFKQPIDTIDEYWDQCLKYLRDYFFTSDWFEVLDFVEFVAKHGPDSGRESFLQMTNSFLERENSAYRFVNGILAEITSQEEIDEVEAAIQAATPYAGVKIHLASALSLMSDRINPNIRNSIKESISAVESLAKQVSGEEAATLGAVLNSLERDHKLHPSLKKAFTSLYGYTSDAEGIRHALLKETNLSKADARFMLVCCSAFCNYVIVSLSEQ